MSTSTIDLTSCCCVTCDVCNGKVLKALTASVTAQPSSVCPGTPISSIVCDCDALNEDIPLSSIGGCCWSGDDGGKTLTCFDNFLGEPTTRAVELAVEVCISKFDSDLVAAGNNFCSGAPQTFYTFLAGHYYVIGTVTVSDIGGSVGVFNFIKDLGTTKPDCTVVHGSLDYVYWTTPGGLLGDTDPNTFPSYCTILSLSIS